MLKLTAAFPHKFLKLLRSNKFLAVHSHVHYFSGLILYLAARARTPQRIAHFRSTTDGKGTSQWRRMRNFVLKRLIDKYATDIVGVSRAALDSALGTGWEEDSRCQVIYNGIDCSSGESLSDRAGVRSEFGLPPDAALMINVGRVSVEKNQERLVRVFASFLKRVPNCYLLLVGKNQEPDNRAIKTMERALGITGKIIEAGTRSDVRRLLFAADLMVAPSLREGLPGAVLEAAAAGTPVLASDIPPMIEVAKYLPIRTMALLESDDAWAAACLDLYQDATLRERLLGAFAISPFTMPRSLGAFCRVYSRVEEQPMQHG